MKAKTWLKKIKRKCLVCGRKISIVVHKGGVYDKGHYFGDFEIPIEGTGRHKKAGTFRLFGKKYQLVKWTGKERKVEYWECEKCYNGKGKGSKPLLGLKARW
ncbi:MAG: hypothetical protein J4478_01695 [Candidatus Diapherotrites archaeon]|uniref:Uncharacterized protein n=1 Tax=Candidatus Iainarchaeum sp. TaxID=3101447 RepID=A0A7J4JU80_9ARCH|nr:hypothetical protein [Candidatus Diapherotrites archaeon]HIH21342.1 hypothetical protein [Candidatus Diapherotrites archaeon]